MASRQNATAPHAAITCGVVGPWALHSLNRFPASPDAIAAAAARTSAMTDRQNRAEIRIECTGIRYPGKTDPGGRVAPRDQAGGEATGVRQAGSHAFPRC